MRLKTCILTFSIFFLSMQLFGQVDRKNAKSMDTCDVKVILSEKISMELSVDSTNQFIVSCNCKLLEYKLSMFDRWGTVVLASYDITEDLKFSDFKKGFYVWVVEVKYPNGRKDSEKGTVKIE